MFPHIITIFIALTACMLSLSGCTDSRINEADDTDRGLSVTFRVTTPRPSHADGKTRATWNDPYTPDAGNDFDNLLLTDQLRVFITDNSCTNQIIVTNLLCSRVTENDQEVSYDFVGRIAAVNLPELNTLTAGKLHIIANAGTTAALDGESVVNLTTNQPGDNFSAIPMWGVSTVDFSGMNENERFDAGTVELLRALAKVEIIIDNDNTGSTEDINIISAINSASVNRCNTGGYVLPAGWNSAASTRDVTKDPVPIREYASPGVPAISAPSADKKSLVFYLPECRNTTEDDELCINLNYGMTPAGDKTDNIYFCRYGNDGKPDRAQRYDIRRNYLYRFIVRRNGNEIAVTADVMPYKTVDLDPDFGLNPPTPETEGK